MDLLLGIWLVLIMLIISKVITNSPRCNRKSGGAAILSYQHRRISPRALGKRKVQHKLFSYYLPPPVESGKDNTFFNQKKGGN
jgi:hypothetical protein